MSLAAPFRPPRRPARRHGRGVLLIGTGADAAPLRDALAKIPEATDLVVVLRIATREDRILSTELAELTLRRGGRLVELTGARSAVALDAGRLLALVADVSARDVYVGGPSAFAGSAHDAALLAGVSQQALRKLTA